jgi:hypothetical protein
MDKGTIEEYRFAEFEKVAVNDINRLSDENFHKGQLS